MTYQPFTDAGLTFLKRLVAEDRISTGQSNLEIHAHDESFHKEYFADVVIWPETTEEVSAIVAYANQQKSP